LVAQTAVPRAEKKVAPKAAQKDFQWAGWLAWHSGAARAVCSVSQTAVRRDGSMVDCSVANSAAKTAFPRAGLTDAKTAACWAGHLDAPTAVCSDGHWAALRACVTAGWSEPHWAGSSVFLRADGSAGMRAVCWAGSRAATWAVLWAMLSAEGSAAHLGSVSEPHLAHHLSEE